MLTQQVSGPQVWRKDTLDAPAKWYQPLTARCRAALEQAIQDWRRHPGPPTDLQAAGEPWTTCRKELQAARAALETGRGFIILQGLPSGGYSAQEQQAMYWVVGQLLGQPFAQNV